MKIITIDLKSPPEEIGVNLAKGLHRDGYVFLNHTELKMPTDNNYEPLVPILKPLLTRSAEIFFSHCSWEEEYLTLSIILQKNQFPLLVLGDISWIKGEDDYSMSLTLHLQEQEPPLLL